MFISIVTDSDDYIFDAGAIATVKLMRKQRLIRITGHNGKQEYLGFRSLESAERAFEKLEQDMCAS